MSSQPIQIIPSGLLGLLQLKNNGRNPSILPDELQSTFELRDWYLETDVRIRSGITAAIPSGTLGLTLTAATHIVPEGEQWVLRGVYASMNVAAADAIRGYVVMQPPSHVATATVRMLGEDFDAPVLAQAQTWVPSYVNQGELLVAQPGTRFGVWLTRNLLAAAQQAAVFVTYSPMRI